MSVTASILRNELRAMARNRTVLTGILLLAMLAVVATVVSLHHMAGASEYRTRQQAAAQAAFDAQPDRHPHRVVHYGHFVYRLPSALAAFDAGVDPFTGSSMFLEGHRQNTANFGDVMQGSVLTRFGQLTPAFVLQILAPLVLVFLGHGVLAQERERGTLRQLLLQGAPLRAIVAGKLSALFVVALVFMLPAFAGLGMMAVAPGASVGVAVSLMLAYALYLGVWCALIAAVSALTTRRRDALLALVGLWAVVALLVPRIAPDVAYAAFPLPDRLQTDVGIAADLRDIGDSHDPDDPYFAGFKRDVLARYDVERIEDLPVNYRGLVAVEGERLTSGLFDTYATRSADIQHRQNALVAGFAALSPAIALRQVSMIAAATDLSAHLHFLEQAEAHRYRMVQTLNQLQADGVHYADDTARDAGADVRKRVDSAHFQAIPEFAFAPAAAGDLMRAMLPHALVLLGWLLAAGALLAFAARRLGVAR
ncbi:MAG: ABC transporter permease [Luteimonas sp.]